MKVDQLKFRTPWISTRRSPGKVEEWNATATACCRGTLKESRDYMFGILINYHCWRFHALAWCRDFEIVDLVVFCTKIDYLWVLKGPGYASMFLILFENTESIPFIDGEMQCVLPRDFTIKTVDEFMQRSSLERGGIRWRIFIHMQYCSCWLVLLCYM